jgi:hypothetical protein
LALTSPASGGRSVGIEADIILLFLSAMISVGQASRRVRRLLMDEAIFMYKN